MTNPQIRDVIQARIDGKPIYYQLYTGGEWELMLPGAPWMFDRARYEVRQKLLELWVNQYPLDSMCPFSVHKNLEDANIKAGKRRLRCIHMIEVP